MAPKKINEDVVVPVSKIPDLISELEALAQQYGVTIVNFGHAGNGNLHVNLMYDPADGDQQQRADACLEAVKAARKMGLTISTDLNYRAKLWKYGVPSEGIMTELTGYCDIILGNEEDALEACQADFSYRSQERQLSRLICDLFADDKVEEEQRLAEHLQQGAGNGQALPLPTAEGHAQAAYLRVVPIRKPGDEVMQPGLGNGLLNFFT